MTNPFNQPADDQPLDPNPETELEIRLTALALGEASDFEREQLTQKMLAQPELRTFYEQIQMLHDSLYAAASGEKFAGGEDWKLPAERRGAVLAALGGDAQSVKSSLANSGAARPQSPQTSSMSSRSSIPFRSVAMTMAKVAAVLLIGAFLGQQILSSTAVKWALRGGTDMAVASGAAPSMLSSGSERKSDWADRSPSPPAAMDGRSTGGGMMAPAAMNGMAIGDMAVEAESDASVTNRFERALAKNGREFGSNRGVVEQLERKMSVDSESAFDEPAEVQLFAGDQAPSEPRGEVTVNGPVQLPSPGYSRDNVEYFKSDSDASFGGSNAPVTRLAPVMIAPGAPATPARRQPSAPAKPSFSAATELQTELAEVREKNQSLRSKNAMAEPESREPESIATLGDSAVLNGPRSGIARAQIIAEDRDQIAAGYGFRLSERNIQQLPQQTAQQEPFSTFSLHVGDVSFKLAQSAFDAGQWPDSAKIRVEEFVNAFDYDDPMPLDSEQVDCTLEQAADPFTQQRDLLRISLRTAAAGRAANVPLRLTCLLDNSGSMERLDRQGAVRRGFEVLAGELKPNDQITLISFARQPRLIADQIAGNDADQLVQLVDQLPAEGGTNLEAALTLAFEKARQQYSDEAQNRIVLLTDGAVNLGDADPSSLSNMISEMRDSGIAFDAAGVIADGLNDNVLETLTRRGDGRYYLIDSVESADDQFALQIAGALRPSAKNVKVQVEFNPRRVGKYRLLGFEKHRLNTEDFRDDQVDAAEMAAAEAGVALYQYEVLPDGDGDIGSVSVRFQDLSSGEMVEKRWPIVYQPTVSPLETASPAMRLSSSAAIAAMKFREDPSTESADWSSLSGLISDLPERYRESNRVQQFRRMIEQAKQISPQQ